MADMAMHSPKDDYSASVDRSAELARLRTHVAQRKSMLVHGPQGVGKTRLLQAFVKAEPRALYVPRSSHPKELLQALAGGLRGLKKDALNLPGKTHTLSTSSLKCVVGRALGERSFVLVLDHVAGPSRVVTGLIKELSDYGQRAIIFAARTPHMEDIGALRPMCADRSERLELKNFPAAVALEFARQEAVRLGLEAANLEATLRSIVDCSAGNPGGILEMLKMATLPKYRTDHQVKAHVLYLDFLMGASSR